MSNVSFNSEISRHLTLCAVQVTTVLWRDSGTLRSVVNTAGWSSQSLSGTGRLPSLSILTSKILTTKVAIILFSCREKIEEDDERFSVEKLERGERKLIIKKVKLFGVPFYGKTWSCVVNELCGVV